MINKSSSTGFVRKLSREDSARSRENKKSDRVHPNQSLKLAYSEYSLKSAIEHHGSNSIAAGHYTATLLTNSGWVKCDDMRVANSGQPNEGYVFVYEKSQSIPAAAQNENNAAQNEANNETPSESKEKNKPAIKKITLIICPIVRFKSKYPS